MTVRFDPEFYTKLKKLDVRIRKSFKERILLFSANPSSPLLRNHVLQREYSGYRSIDITADYRAIYQEKLEGTETVAYFVLIGTHEELYGT